MTVVLLAVGSYLVFVVVLLTVHHRLGGRPRPGRWWAHIDGPPTNVRRIERSRDR